MQQVKCRSMYKYLATLDGDERLRKELEETMSVSVSRFFRDRMLWELVEDHIVPEILSENRERVKVWDAGCACGEEVYSLKIVWETLRDRFESMPELEIVATDINPEYLRRARRGVYTQSSLREIPEGLREIYFKVHRGQGLYRIAPSLKKGISWRVHNILHGIEGNHFQMIFLRNNLLTYYNDELKRPAFQRIVNSFARGGFLIIGSHEALPFGSINLLPFHDQPYIFKKV